MFSSAQQRTWTTSHLNAGSRYLACRTTFTPLHKIEKKQSREATGVSGVEIINLKAIEDDDVRDKAIKKRLESDHKKAQKVREAEEKAEHNERERLEKALEKAG